MTVTQALGESMLLDAAFKTLAGIKAINEDSAGLRIPDEHYEQENKGAVFVVADGVSSAEAGREASTTAVERFIDEYFQTPDTWSVHTCGEKVLATLNLRLYRKSHDYSAEGKGFLTTFTAAVIKGQTAYFFHVGDSRLWLLRGKELRQITHDHVAIQGEGQSFLSRALGMDSRLNIDCGRIPLQEGDVLLLCSDGVHDFIAPDRLRATLAANDSAHSIAVQLCQLALQQGSDDNVSAVVTKVKALSQQSPEDYQHALTRLPFPPELTTGMLLDGYRVERELYASSRSQLYLVHDEETGTRLVMKTPSLHYEEDLAYIDRFIQEEWVGLRIRHPNVVQVVNQRRSRTCLYYLMEYLEGEGLDKWILQHQPPKPKQAITLVKQVAAGLEAFHANEAVHQDLKPGNILITPDQRAVILDFGSVWVAGLSERGQRIAADGVLGTAAYSDPIYLRGQHPGIQGDVYSLATITYEMFCGQLPYGEAAEECQSAWDYDRLRYIPASPHNPIIPVWFDQALKKGCHFDLDQRYATVADLMHDLQQPNPVFLQDDPVEQNNASKLLFWKLMSGFWFVTLCLLIYLFSQAS